MDLMEYPFGWDRRTLEDLTKNPSFGMYKGCLIALAQLLGDPYQERRGQLFELSVLLNGRKTWRE